MAGFEIKTGKYKFSIFDDGNLLVEADKDISCKVLRGSPLIISKKRIMAMKYYNSKILTNIEECTLGVVAPYCNLKCDYCFRETFPKSFMQKTTDPEILSYVLDKFRQDRMHVCLSFFNNEVFTSQSRAWQKDVVNVIDKNRDVVSSILVYTNGVGLLHDDYELLDYIVSTEYKSALKHRIVLAAVAGNHRKNQHLSFSSREIDEILSKLFVKGVKQTYINLLVRPDEKIDFSEEMAKTISKWHKYITLDACVTFGEKTKVDSDDVVLENISNIIRAVNVPIKVQSRALGTYAVYQKEIPFDFGIIPRYTVIDRERIFGNCECKYYNLKQGIKKISSMYYSTVGLNVSKCDQCKSGNDRIDDCIESISNNKCLAGIKPSCLSCSLLGSCSGFYYYGHNDCAGEYNTSLLTFALHCKSAEVGGKNVNDIRDRVKRSLKCDNVLQYYFWRNICNEDNGYLLSQ